VRLSGARISSSQQIDDLLVYIFSGRKSKIFKVGSLRTAGRLTFVHAATKVSKNAFLLAEGISFA